MWHLYFWCWNYAHWVSKKSKITKKCVSVVPVFILTFFCSFEGFDVCGYVGSTDVFPDINFQFCFNHFHHGCLQYFDKEKSFTHWIGFCRKVRILTWKQMNWRNFSHFDSLFFLNHLGIWLKVLVSLWVMAVTWSPVDLISSLIPWLLNFSNLLITKAITTPKIYKKKRKNCNFSTFFHICILTNDNAKYQKIHQHFCIIK